MRKSLRIPNRWGGAGIVCLVLAATICETLAADRVKENNSTALNDGASWVGGTAPGSGDVAVWDNTVSNANTTVLGGNVSWGGIRIADPGGPVTVDAGNTLTLGTSGIDMSSASNNLEFRPGVRLDGSQTWTVHTNRALAVGGSVTTKNGITLNANGDVSVPGTLSTPKKASATWNVNGTLSAGAMTGAYTGDNWGSRTVNFNVNAGASATIGTMTISRIGWCQSTTAKTYINVKAGAELTAITIQGHKNDHGAVGSKNVQRYLNVTGGRLTATTINLSQGGDGDDGVSGNVRRVTLNNGTLANRPSGNLSVDSRTRIRLLNNATIEATDGRTIDVYGTIYDSGNLTKTGTGWLNVRKNPTFAGTTTVSNGVLQLRDLTSYPSAMTIRGAGDNSASVRCKYYGTASRTLNAGTIALDGGRLDFQAGNHYLVLDSSTPIVNAADTSSFINAYPGGSGNSGLFLDGGLQGTGTVTLAPNTVGSGINLRNNTTTFSGTLIVNGTASTTPGAGSGLGVGGCTTGLSNADVEVNGTLELNKSTDSLSWANTGAGAFAVGALSGSGVVVGHNDATLTTAFSVGANGHDGTFSGVIADGENNTLNLVKRGTGTQTLTGESTHTGGTTVEDGTLILGDSGTLGGGCHDGALALSAAASLFVHDSSADQELSGAIDGSGALLKTGTGMLTLSGANGYSGATVVSNGTLVVVAGGACSNSTVRVSGATNATLTVRVRDQAAQWPCAGLTFEAGTNSLEFNYNLVVPGTSSAPVQVAGDVAFDGEPGVTIATRRLPIGTYPLIAWAGTQSGTVPTNVTLPARIAGELGLSGDGHTLLLNVTTNFEPLSWATGDGQWDVDITQNWKDNAGTPRKYLEGVLWGDSVLFEDSQSGTSPITVTLNTNVNPGIVTADNTVKDFTITGTGGIGGGTGLTKDGAGTLTLETPNTFTGDTTIGGGKLKLACAGVPFDTGILSPAVHIGDGATLEIAAAWNVKADYTVDVTGAGSAIHLTAGSGADSMNYLNNVALNSGASITGNAVRVGNLSDGNYTVGGSNICTISAGLVLVDTTNNSEMVVNVAETTGDAASDLVVSGLVADLASYAGLRIVKTGAGTLELTNTGNSWDGGLSLNGGTLRVPQLTGGNADGPWGGWYGTSAYFSFDGGTLEYTGGTVGGINRAFTIDIGGATLNIVNTNANVIWTDAGGAGPITGAGGLTKTGAGALTLAGDNDFSGATIVNGGTLKLDKPGLLSPDDGNVSTSIYVNTGATLAVRQDWNLDETAAIEVDGGTLDMASGLNYLNNVALTNGAAITGSYFASGYFSDALCTVGGSGAATISADITLAKGADTTKSTFRVGEVTGDANADLTLSGNVSENPSYPGSSFVKEGAGRLTLTGTNSYSGATVVSNGTLTLDGSLANANITVVNGRLDGSGTLYSRLADDTADRIRLTGTGVVDVTGLTLEVLRSGAQSAAEYVLIDDYTRVAGPFAAETLPPYWSVDYDGTVANPNAVVLWFDMAAATRTWDGGDVSNSLWSGATNWVGEGLPIEGTVLRFPEGEPRASNTNDLLDFVYGLDLEGGYTLSGDELTVGAGIESAGTNTLSLPLTLTTPSPFDVSSGTLKASGGLSGPGGVTKAGEGTLEIGGGNLCLSDTVVSNGTLRLGDPATGDALPVDGASLWLRADGITNLADGAAVATWTDESGGERNATQGTAGHRPLFKTGIQNGLPVVRFDGSDDRLGYDGTFLANTDYTIFLVEARGDTAANYILQGTDNNSNRNLHFGYRSNAVFTHAQYANDYNMDVAGYGVPRFTLYSADLDATGGNGKHTWRNGVLLGSKANNVRLSNYTGATIGGKGNYKGDVAEIVMYARALTAPEREAVERYLIRKWLPALPYAAGMRIAEPGTVDLNGRNLQVAALNDGNGAGGVVTNSGGTATVLTVNGGTDSAFSGVIVEGTNGTVGLLKSGTGTLRLAGDAGNTYTADTIFRDGTLIFAKTSGNAVGGNLVWGDSGSSHFGKWEADEQIADSATLDFGTSGHMHLELLGHTETVARIVATTTYGVIENRQAEDGINESGTIIVDGSEDSTYSAYLRDNSGGSGSGVLNLVKAGTGTLTIGGNKTTYTGTTTVHGGELVLTGSGLTGTSAAMIDDGATVTLSGSGNNQLRGGWTVAGVVRVTTATAHTLYGNVTLNDGTMDSTGGYLGNYGAYFAGANRTITANGSTNVISGNGRFGIASGKVLTLHTPLSTDSLDVGIEVGAGSSGTAGGVTKTGAGTVTLGGDNTYSGATVVNGGTLRLSNTNGAATGTGTVTVNNGGKLAGEGSAAGGVTVNAGGSLSPGSEGTGTLTLNGGLLLGNGAVIEVDLAADSDLIRIPGGTVTGADTEGVTVKVALDPGARSGERTIVDWTGAAAAGVELEDFVVELEPGVTGTPQLAIRDETLVLRLDFGTVLLVR